MPDQNSPWGHSARESQELAGLPPEQDGWGHCACICCCSHGGDGPDQLCSHCRVGIHARDISSDLDHLRALANEYITSGRFVVIDPAKVDEHVRARERFWREHPGRAE